MAKKSFVFYKEWKDAIQDLPDEIRLEVYDGIIEYAVSGNIPVLKPMAKVAFNFIKNDIDRDATAYADKCAKNQENAKKGGAPKGNKNALKTTETTERLKKQPKQPDNDNDNDIKKKSVKEKFTPPDISEVKSYCLERANRVDAERFVDFYSAKDWMIGKNKMKDWRAAVRTWEKEDKQKGGNNESRSESRLHPSLRCQD